MVVGLAATLAAAASMAQSVVPTKDPQHPRIRYEDSLLSLNDRCMVRGGTLNPTFRPVYINGRPVGFC
jgi:hypothetical protein